MSLGLLLFLKARQNETHNYVKMFLQWFPLRYSERGKQRDTERTDQQFVNTTGNNIRVIVVIVLPSLHEFAQCDHVKMTRFGLRRMYKTSIIC